MQDPIERLAHVKEFGEHGGVNASVETSTTFTVLQAGTLPAIFHGEKGPDGGCYVYGRSFNPTVRALSKQLAALEDTESAYATSSGMAAISCALLGLCKAGDHIVASNTVYGGTFAFLKSFMPEKCGITTTFVDVTDLQAVQKAMMPNTKVVYTECVSNPTLVVAPLDALAGIAHAHGAQLVVDNTFTPFIITPTKWGADVVVHSMTKFMSGASDIIAGCVCGSNKFITSLMDFHTGPLMLLGPTMDPRIAGELALRLPHLGLRMQEHSRRAQVFAQRLHAAGAKVTYPGLPSHPQYELLIRLANPGYGMGGLMGLDLGSKEAGDAFMERLQNKHGFGYMAVSLGYFDTLMSASAASTSSELKPEELLASGISTGYVRMSVGITGSLEQRWAQLEEAYAFIVKGGAKAPYRAIKVVPTEVEGAPPALLSWPSLGSETCLPDMAVAPATAAAATAMDVSADHGAAAAANLRHGGYEYAPVLKDKASAALPHAGSIATNSGMSSAGAAIAGADTGNAAIHAETTSPVARAASAVVINHGNADDGVLATGTAFASVAGVSAGLPSVAVSPADRKGIKYVPAAAAHAALHPESPSALTADKRRRLADGTDIVYQLNNTR